MPRCQLDVNLPLYIMTNKQFSHNKYIEKGFVSKTRKTKGKTNNSISVFKLISFAHNLRMPDLFWRKVREESSYVLAQQACMLDVPSS